MIDNVIICIYALNSLKLDYYCQQITAYAICLPNIIIRCVNRRCLDGAGTEFLRQNIRVLGGRCQACNSRQHKNQRHLSGALHQLRPVLFHPRTLSNVFSGRCSIDTQSLLRLWEYVSQNRNKDTINLTLTFQSFKDSHLQMLGA